MFMRPFYGAIIGGSLAAIRLNPMLYPYGYFVGFNEGFKLLLEG